MRNWSGLADEYWSAKTAYDEKKREYSTTFEYPRDVTRAEPTDLKDNAQLFRPVVVQKRTYQAYRANPTFLRLNLVPVVGTEGHTLVNVPVATFTDSNPLAQAGNYISSIDWGDMTPVDTGSVVQRIGAA